MCLPPLLLLLSQGDSEAAQGLGLLAVVSFSVAILLLLYLLLLVSLPAWFRSCELPHRLQADEAQMDMALTVLM